MQQKQNTRTKGLRICKELFKNKTEKKKDIKETIKVFKFWVLYLKTLLGLEPAHSGQCLKTYEDANAELQAKIDDLLAEQAALRHDYETAHEQIPQLDKEIQELIEKMGNIHEEIHHTKQNIHKMKTLKEKIKALEEELKAGDFNLKDFEDLLKEEK